MLTRNRRPFAENDAFIEADGYVSFLAENYTRAHNSAGVGWKRIPNLGLISSSMSAFSRAGGAIALGPEIPHLEYDFYAFTEGDVTVEVTLAPTLDFKDEGGLKYALSIDDETPATVYVNENLSEDAWSASVAKYAQRRSSRHAIPKPGAHTLKLRLIDPALVFEKITIHSGAAPESYLGPPQSLRASNVH
ncbi:hypothetical protein [Hyphococcus luteus]|uniref:Gylcosyl hydrolase 115 C-terminal domain-containing protein n=1 Tax=Hyphococcus luteus TaxID=2058213 RepID=A0A2S7KAK5_9PROT|nr:hypothetical protein [Marinicaulis flavus]PQA89508.1 hypothetical protein CW354_01150 [Marinicaulis flavus]